MNNTYELLESNQDGMYEIKINEDPFKGIKFTFGKVQFLPDEDDDKYTMNFEYDIIEDNGISYNKKDFEQYIGKLLESIIEESLKNNEIIYSGGTGETDETRNENTCKSYLQ